MAIYYLDSSALVKRYIAETGSSWVLNLLAPATSHTVFIAAIAPVEITAAIMGRARGQSIPMVVARAACERFQLDVSIDSKSWNSPTRFLPWRWRLPDDVHCVATMLYSWPLRLRSIASAWQADCRRSPLYRLMPD